MRIVVAGGGAAGFFGAIAAAESIADAEVILLEKSPELLAKVTISGGGRCNVTHACFDPKELSTRYPRGGRELIGPFHRWQPRDTVDWFESRGVKLKTEADGRMFPTTDKSTTITDCLLKQARNAGVQIVTGKGLLDVNRTEKGFVLRLTSKETLACDRLLIATGGNQASAGRSIAESLGHTIVPPVPSLFTFNVKDRRIEGLAGLSVAKAEASVPSQKLSQRGPVLITHWGFSGPAILKLSAWGARVLHDVGYDFELVINWLPAVRVEERLRALKLEHAKRCVVAWSPFPEIATRLWASLIRSAGVPDDRQWATLSRLELDAMTKALGACAFHARGKSMFKDEFVTCGGVSLKEVDFKTMQSRVCPGLYFAGEVLDIDGVTGGFNFQAAWTTGWIAGKSMGQEG